MTDDRTGHNRIKEDGIRRAFAAADRAFARGMLGEDELRQRIRDVICRFSLLPPEEPPPHIVCPCKHYTHVYHDCATVSVDFSCADKIPAAPKELLLRNELGLAAVIRGAVTAADGRSLSGEGTIEGYTAAAGRTFPRLVLDIDTAGRVCRIGYTEDAADAAAFRSFPLWQDYFAWLETAEKERRCREWELFSRYLR